MLEPTDLSDEDLFDRWRAGEAPAGHVLFTRHFKGLYGFFRDRAGDDAEDLIQRAMLGTLESAHRFERRSRFSSFLFGTARHVLFEHYRAQRRPGATFDPDLDTLVDLSIGPSTMLRRCDEHEIVRAALRQIPVDDAILLNLYIVEGLTATELAEQYCVPENTVRSRIRRAKDRLEKAVLAVATDPAVGERTSGDLDRWLLSVGDATRHDPRGPDER